MHEYVRPIEDIDEFVNALRRGIDEADARVEPWQSKLKGGDCFVREWDDMSIYGRILNDSEYLADGEMPPRRHSVMAQCFSEACPEGEFGIVHVSDIDEQISSEEFVSAIAALE